MCDTPVWTIQALAGYPNTKLAGLANLLPTPNHRLAYKVALLGTPTVDPRFMCRCCLSKKRLTGQSASLCIRFLPHTVLMPCKEHLTPIRDIQMGCADCIYDGRDCVLEGWNNFEKVIVHPLDLLTNESWQMSQRSATLTQSQTSLLLGNFATDLNTSRIALVDLKNSRPKLEASHANTYSVRQYLYDVEGSLSNKAHPQRLEFPVRRMFPPSMPDFTLDTSHVQMVNDGRKPNRAGTHSSSPLAMSLIEQEWTQLRLLPTYHGFRIMCDLPAYVMSTQDDRGWPAPGQQQTFAQTEDISESDDSFFEAPELEDHVQDSYIDCAEVFPTISEDDEDSALELWL